MDLEKEILKVKPHLASGSIKNYKISLQKLHERMFDTKVIDNLKWLEDDKKVLDELKDYKRTTKRKSRTKIFRHKNSKFSRKRVPSDANSFVRHSPR